MEFKYNENGKGKTFSVHSRIHTPAYIGNNQNNAETGANVQNGIQINKYRDLSSEKKCTLSSKMSIST